MANEEIKDKVENPETNPVESADTKQEDFVSPGVSGPGPGVLDKIASIFTRKKPEPDENKDITPAVTDDTDDVTVTDDTTKGTELDKTGEADEYDEIDPKFVEIASKYGWDDRRIVDYAETHSDEDMLLLANLMQDYVSKINPEVKDSNKAEDTELNEVLKLAETDPKVATILNKIVEPLARRLDSVSSVSDEIKRDLDLRKESDQLKEYGRNLEVANDLFDKSDILSLGKTKDIPTYPDGNYVPNSPLFQERVKIWDVATLFHAKGGTFQQAVKEALQWYKGANLEKDVKDKVVQDLKKQEERVMPKRQEQLNTKTYANEEERKADIINAALSKYNKQLPIT